MVHRKQLKLHEENAIESSIASSTHDSTRTQLLDKLPQLQNLVKRDPQGYWDEFLMQYRHYESELEILQLQPTKESPHFASLVSFLSHTARCYPEHMKSFPGQIMDLLQQHSQVLPAATRKSLAQSLILMRNHNLIDPVHLLKVFFELLRCQDKKLRELLYNHILADIRNINKKGHNQDVNRNLQTVLYNVLQQEQETISKIALDILVEMYRKKIWIDQRTVNVIANAACTSKNTRIVVSSLQFFLGIDQDILNDEEEEEQKKKETIDVDYHEHSKKTRKRHRQTRSQLVKNRKARNRSEQTRGPIFPALEVLHDPQGVVDKQFKMLQSCNERFEVKLLMMNFIACVIGCHQLICLRFYSYLQRYMNSHQKNVINILAYLVQACHDQVPPEELLDVVKTICNQFITERSSSQVISVGMNAIREMFQRVPLILECEGMDALIEDLIMYNKSKDKGTVIASRGVLNLIREIHPALLRKKQRGKFHDAEARPKQFGELVVAKGVEGADLLQEAEASGRFDHVENEDDWQVTSDEEDDDGEWVTLSDDDEDEQRPIDSEEEEEEDEEEEEEEESNPVPTDPKKRLDAQRILTPRDFERIAMLKKEAKEAAKDPKMRRKKRKADEAVDEDISVGGPIRQNAPAHAAQVNPKDLEGYVKKRRQTQEERLRSVLKGRVEFTPRQTGGGSTNKEKERKKHFLMLKKSRAVQEKMLRSTRQIQHGKNKTIKKELKREKQKRRRA